MEPTSTLRRVLPRVVVVMPTYNEANNLERVVVRVLEESTIASFDCVVLVVDDNSPDGTASIAARLGEETGKVRTLVRPKKMGLGSAYKEAFKFVIEKMNDVDVVVEMDADGSHDPASLRSIVQPILRGEADVVIGSRYIEGGGWLNKNRWRLLTSLGGNLLARLCTGLRLKDLTSGYRAIVARLIARTIDRLGKTNRGYVFQVESLALYACEGARIIEVPIKFMARRSGRSKLTTGDVASFIGWNLRYLMRRIFST